MRSLLAAALLLAPLASACAGPSLCERKARFLTEQCSGGSVAATVDPLCEKKTKKCTPGQLAQMDGYVSCLEAAKMCSLEVMGRCQQKYPGGVNLECFGPED